MKNNRLIDLIYTGLLVAIGIILTYVLSIAYPPGQVYIKFGFGYLPLMIISMLFGPGIGLFSGAIQDVVGYFTFGTSTGPYFFGFTINSMLVGVLPWLIMKIKTKKVNLFLYINYALFFVIFGASLYLLFDISQISDRTSVSVFWDYFILIASIISVLVLAFFVWKKRKSEPRTQQIIFMIIFIEILTTIILTPIWINIMYGIPYLPQLPLRIVKLPVEVFIYSILLIEIDNRVRPMFNKNKSA